MPKFVENEKIYIQNKLIEQGEKLFSVHGIKKVTVDDLVKAAGIAKGSFYVFYKTKESLYLEIIDEVQRRMYTEMEQFLNKNKKLSPKDLTSTAFYRLAESIKQYSVLMQLNTDTIDYLYRKLPNEIIEKYQKIDTRFIEKLMEHGVNFKYSPDIVVQVFHAIFVVQQTDSVNNQSIIEILVNGAICEMMD